MSDVQLHLGDCLSVLRSMEPGSVDAIICDPPFVVKDAVEIRGGGVAPRKQQSTTIGDQGWYYGKEWLAEAGRVCRGPILAFGNYLDLFELLEDRGQGSLRGVLVWRKPNAPLPAWNVPHYDTTFICWWGRGKNSSGVKRVKSMVIDCPFPAAGCFATERIVDETGKSVHPSQAPLKLMTLLVEAFTEPGETVMDPFMGSGTTGVACRQVGRRFIGIERDPTYFAIAEKRIAAAQREVVQEARFFQQPTPDLFGEEA